MAMRQSAMAFGAVLLACSGCVVAPPPQPVVASAGVSVPYASYPYYSYYPYYGYSPYYAPYCDYPWIGGPNITLGLGFGSGWGGWRGGGWGRGGRR